MLQATDLKKSIHFKIINRIICLLILFIPALLMAGEETKAGERSITLKLPPPELAKWYKPANKRQVWLHTMFRLRREILAIQDYASEGQQAELQKWTDKFAKDYQSIAQMVPEWEKYLLLDKLELLQTAVKKQQYSELSPILKKLGKSCMRCHDDYQAVSTLLYRSADFNQQSVVDSQTQETLAYDEVMEQLSDSVNRINIAIKDGYFEKAAKHIKPLKTQLSDLSRNCNQCHKKDTLPVKRIMGLADELLPELEQQLNFKDKKQSGRKLGEFAVYVCARCHAVHRLTSDLKNVIE